MCLYKGNAVHKIAQEYIICYKTARKYKSKLLTFFQLEEFKLNVPIEPANPESVEFMDTEHCLEGEVVHAFQSEELDHRELRDELDIAKGDNCRGLLYDLVLVKCVIPKGTIYYEDIPDMTGIYGRQYGATKIIPIEIVKYYTNYVEGNE